MKTYTDFAILEKILWFYQRYSYMYYVCISIESILDFHTIVGGIIVVKIQPCLDLSLELNIHSH